MSTADARRPFANVSVFRRIGLQAELDNNARVLELGGGSDLGALWLAQKTGCEAVILVADDAAEAAAKKLVDGAGVGKKVTVKKGDLGSAGLSPSSFHAIVSLNRRYGPLRSLVESLRPLLAERGRLCLTYPVKVGRAPSAGQVGHWEKELKEPLLSPRDALGILGAAGFEPEWAESLSDQELDAFYDAWESGPLTETEKQETTLHRAQAGKSSVSIALLMGRRREPGEKPPTTRDRG